MQRKLRRAVPLLAAVVLLALTACSGKPPAASSSEEAKVSGKITIRGKPMKGGEITFNPANYQRKDAQPRSAKINDDGTYEITTLVGQNSVSLSGPAIQKEPQLGYGAMTVEVQSGTNTKDIALPPPQ